MPVDFPPPNASSARLQFRTIASPVGDLKLVASDVGLVALLWGEDDSRIHLKDLEPASRDHAVLGQVEDQLKEYFLGERTKFDVALDFRGTPFQKQVWSELLQIPYGETRSYREIAQNLKNPKAVRAVGAANGKNPISIVAPCHRVIGASGKLTGFAGGLRNKEFLLKLESSSARS